METDLPAPLTPSDCDLRDFSFMPLDIVRLFSSDFHATASDGEWRAGVTLWGKSWHQVPAASLPDDDGALARLAEFGRDGRSWAKVKAKALHGWVKCSDGRLYHRVVAEKALEAWIEKLGQRKSSGAGNAKRWGGEFDPAEINSAIQCSARMLVDINPQSRTLQKRTANTANEAPNGIPNGNPEDIPSGSQGTGTGTLKKKVPLPKGNGQAAPALVVEDEKPQGEKPSDPWAEVYRRGKEILGQNAGGTVTLLRNLFDEKPRKVLAKLEDAAEQREPVPWINAFLWANVERLPPGSHVGPIARMA